MPENPAALSNKNIYNEQIVNDVIHFASTKEVSVQVSNINIKDSTVINNVTISLRKSYEFQELIEKERSLEEIFSLLPEADVEKRLEISSKLKHQKDVTRGFVQDILTLAEQFQRIEINTDRLKRAKEFFDSGEFGKARAVLEVELEQMKNEQTQLLVKRKEYETETLPKLKNNSAEFLILALSTRLDYDNKNRVADSRKYFELSIKSYETKDNVFEYAKFLKDLRSFNEAEAYFERYLKTFDQQLSLYERGMALRHLADLHQSKNENETALKEYQAVLDICEKMSKGTWDYLELLISTSTHLANLSSEMNLDSDTSRILETLINAYRIIARENAWNKLNLANLASALDYSGAFYRRAHEFEKAAKFYEEALEIRRQLAAEDPPAYLSHVATSLNNFGSLHLSQKKYDLALAEYGEALTIYRKCAVDDPATCLPDMSAVLNNLANVHIDKEEYDAAFDELEEALAIKSGLAKTDPKAYLPHVAASLVTLGSLHKDVGDYDSALSKYEEALEIYRKFAADSPSTYLPDVALTLNNLGTTYWTMSVQEEELAETFRSAGKDHFVSDENVKRLQSSLSKYAPVSYEETRERIERTFNERLAADFSQNYEKAARAYQEALEIYRKFSEKNPAVYLPYFVITLNHLGLLHAATGKEAEAARELEQVLKLRRDLAVDNPSVYLPEVAKTLTVLGQVLGKQKKSKESIAALGEALNIRVKLLEDVLTVSHKHPLAETYGEDVVESLNDIALFFQESMVNREWSIGYALNAWILMEGIIRNTQQKTDRRMGLLSTTMTILQKWGLSDERISNLLTAQVKAGGINPRYYGVNIPRKSSFRFWKAALLIGILALILYFSIQRSC